MKSSFLSDVVLILVYKEDIEKKRRRMLPKFVEFAGSKGYQCPKCRADIRYAKFFGDDKKLLTTDGKEPWAGEDDSGRYKTNTGWPTDPTTKQIHECKEKSQEITVKTQDGNFHTQFPTQLTKIDEKVRDRIIEDAYLRAKFLIWKLEGVEKACKELGKEIGPVSGMVYNQVCAEDRRLEQNGE